jgi:hypothetical protein
MGNSLAEDDSKALPWFLTVSTAGLIGHFSRMPSV